MDQDTTNCVLLRIQVEKKFLAKPSSGKTSVNAMYGSKKKILLETVATILHYLKCFKNIAGCLTLLGWFISVNIYESGSSLNGKN